MPNDVTFYHPGNSWFENDGTLVMGVSTYDDQWHSTGVRHFRPDDPDYEMWCCFTQSLKASPPSIPFVSGEQLEAIREEFRRERARSSESQYPQR
jgi:hypothetical protein